MAKVPYNLDFRKNRQNLSDDPVERSPKPLKREIEICLEKINSLDKSIEAMVKRAISELPKENMEVGIYLMNLQKISRMAKAEAERTQWCIDRHLK